MEHRTDSQHRESLLKAMPDVSGYIQKFRSINKRWDGAITAGMLETGRMEADAGRLFGPLIQDMGSTKAKYSKIQERLVDAILSEMVRKVVFEITDAAKFAINILKRNLYERTADVGYLATDSEIGAFLRQVRDKGGGGYGGSGPALGGDADATAEHHESMRELLRKRLEDYRHEYTVYDEILILGCDGTVHANLDRSNRVSHCADPLLGQTLAIDLHDPAVPDKYVETFRESDLRPGRGNTLVYSQKIEDPETHEALGVICLCFDFDDEMQRIFQDLDQGNHGMTVGILDESGYVIASNAPDLLPLGSQAPVDLDADYRLAEFQSKPYLISTVATDGYQGFYGLTWYGLAMVDAEDAFCRDEDSDGPAQAACAQVRQFSRELTAIKNESDDLLADMKLDSLNGQVKAAQFAADGFVEVLRFVNWIGDEIDGLFFDAIKNLQRTVVASLFNDVQFRAFLGNNIADRNLYERANDVCWWALTPLFRTLLTKHLDQGLSDSEREALRANLQYINDLYTPYLRLVLADAQGAVVACSDPPEGLEERFAAQGLPRGQEFVGTQVDQTLLRRALTLESDKDYCVSDFAPTPLYGGRPTWIYSTAVRDPDDQARAVGVIQIVFDAEPQLEAMLRDSLPTDEHKQVRQDCFAVFADRSRTVVASTSPAHPVGQRLPLDDALFQLGNGERDSAVVELDGRSYALGVQVSNGYREYKRGDGYENDMLCLIGVPI